MSMFEKIAAQEWDKEVRACGGGSSLLTSQWEKMLHQTFSFVSFGHYRYRDRYTMRIACIRDRHTTAPFSEGGDVVGRDSAPLDISQFKNDVLAEFGDGARLRINERFCAVVSSQELPSAHEHVVSLADDLTTPPVRKTLRHILEKSIPGSIERARSSDDIAHAYQLYLLHMRRVQNLAMPYVLFRSLLDDLGGELWVWKNNSRMHAMALFLMSKEEALYALSATDRDGLRAHAPHHLVHHALEQYRPSGIRRVSLGTTGVDSALETFKRGWRGTEHAVYEVGGGAHEKTRTSPLRLLVRLVPLSLYPSLSRTLGKHFL